MKKYREDIDLDEIKAQIKEKQDDNKNTLSLTVFLSMIIFVTSILILAVSALVIYLLVKTGVITMFGRTDFRPSNLFFILMTSSLITGFVLAVITKKMPMKMVDSMVNQINRLASGDYSARIDFGKNFKRVKSVTRIENSFNKMAEELENTEVLRSDFIDNFSHEFKTPIVSISGFAKLLRRGNLTDEQKEEYLAAIEEESLRLSYMATNILNLTKVENQNILTNITRFNLSEQIRDSILMLEEAWTKKRLELSVDFDEYEITANQEMLKQVWINLLDNAIKFSPDYGILEVKISADDEIVSVSVTNNGEPIPESVKNKIFNRFYQADESHASVGNGIGLSIVKRIVELHKGVVSLVGNDNLTTFTVTLPR